MKDSAANAISGAGRDTNYREKHMENTTEAKTGGYLPGGLVGVAASSRSF